MNCANNLINRKKIVWIANNYELTSHAKERIKERMDTTRTIKDLILNTPLAWKSGANKYCIGLNLYEYIVVALGNDRTEPAKVITFVNTQESAVNIIDKFVYSYLDLKARKKWLDDSEEEE